MSRPLWGPWPTMRLNFIGTTSLSAMDGALGAAQTNASPGSPGAAEVQEGDALLAALPDEPSVQERRKRSAGPTAHPSPPQY